MDFMTAQLLGLFYPHVNIMRKIKGQFARRETLHLLQLVKTTFC